MLWQIIVFSILGSIGGLVGGVILTFSKKPFTHSQSLLMISFAAGVMLATAFLDILPEAGIPAWWVVLSGVVFLFLLEKSLIWFHHHGDDCESHTPIMMTVGDSLHNLIDGIVIGSTFLVSPATGIITSLAIMAHEIPHEMADFGVMLSLGWSKKKVVFINFLSASISIFGALGVFFISNFIQIENYLPVLLSFAGGMFIYLACSDLIPELHHAHHKAPVTNNLTQIIVFGLGLLLISVLVTLLH